MRMKLRFAWANRLVIGLKLRGVRLNYEEFVLYATAVMKQKMRIYNL